MAERTTEQVPRSGRRPGFHMKPKHVGLVSCASLVGCMVAFGAGFIVGMEYKASEQISPYVVKKSLTVESSEQQSVSNAAWEEKSLIFYDTLIKNESVDMVPAAGTTQTPKPAPEPTPAIKNEPVDRVPAAETTQTPEPAPEPAHQTLPVTAEGVDPNPQATDPAAAPTLGSAESVAASYSVQVASFLTPEHAERLIEDLTKKGYRAYVHPFEAPGQPLWYRVKVGKFADRAAANVALQKLRSREIPDAMITRD